ncbi:MAG: type IX secretion system membrane protein PorP/SprF [Bacteroidetes bacterium]|nr:type IX secretion system membrane protein PorP/SprF [Bacteroidota bacterium]
MRIVVKYMFCLLLLFAKTVVAQDIHFTQFYAVPMYLNPAFAGMEKCSKLSFASRNQWSGVNKGYNTYLFSYDDCLPKINSGLGIVAATDVAGTGNLKTNLVNVNYSYEALITRKMSWRFGMQAGYVQKSINYNNLLFGDQIARGGNVPSLDNAVSSRSFLDLSAGSVFYTDMLWVGVSVNHLNKPNEAISTVYAELPMKTSVHSGLRIKLNDPPRKAETKYLIPCFNYMHQNKFNQASFGLYYDPGALNFGLWYRGIPFINKPKQGYSTNDAVNLLISFSNDKFHFGYSYDITISRLTPLSGGAHEVVAYYKICRKKKKRNTRLAPCPKF